VPLIEVLDLDSGPGERGRESINSNPTIIVHLYTHIVLYSFCHNIQHTFLSRPSHFPHQCCCFRHCQSVCLQPDASFPILERGGTRRSGGTSAGTDVGTCTPGPSPLTKTCSSRGTPAHAEGTPHYSCPPCSSQAGPPLRLGAPVVRPGAPRVHRDSSLRALKCFFFFLFFCVPSPVPGTRGTW